jgi:hypothetical protein
MPTSAPRMPNPTGVAAEAAASPASAETADDGFAAACAGLSNDFLNHYSEALMLIEMAADDPAIGAELQEWRPIGYRAYFASSELRRAAAALAAYDALPERRRQAFERLVASMDTLATMAVFALQPPSTPESIPWIVEATAPALRELIAKAAAFLNSGGQDLAPDRAADEAQAVIDRIIEHAGSRPGA